MYLSGTWKDQAINFYKERMTSFGADYFDYKDMTIMNDGSITSLPFESNDIESRLSRKQEFYITKGIKRTKNLAESKNYNSSLLRKELEALFNAPRTYAFALFECLYKLIQNARNNYDLENKLRDFQIFRMYVDTVENISQVELDILIELFLAGVSYLPDDVRVRTEEKFKIDENDYLNGETREIISLGKFIAPKRVPGIARTLQDRNEMTKYVVPIYFAIRNDVQARNFLNACKTVQCDNPSYVINQAKACGVPENLRQLVLNRR